MRLDTHATSMRRSKAFRLLFNLIQSAALTLVGTACMTSTNVSGQRLGDAGDRMGVPLRVQGSLNYEQFGSQLTTAPAANLEKIPATQYPAGVDIGVSFLNLRGATATVPEGFYKLRAFVADASHTGRVKGHVQLMNTEGRVVADLPADFDIRSLSVPPSASSRRTVLSLKSGPIISQPNESQIYLCYDCPNGLFWCAYFEHSWFNPEF